MCGIYIDGFSESNCPVGELLYSLPVHYTRILRAYIGLVMEEDSFLPTLMHFFEVVNFTLLYIIGYVAADAKFNADLPRLGALDVGSPFPRYG